jgi:hypothetical protein
VTPNTLTERLRGIVRVPVNDGAGLLDGKDFFERSFPTSKLALEAADRIERLETTLNYVADMTYCGTDAEWHFKPGYDPQEVMDVLDRSSPSPLQAPHNPGERLRNSDVAAGEGGTPPARQENDDVFKGFRGNNEA